MNSRRMRHIKRCNNFPCVFPEDVAQHSYFVALLSNIFVDEFNSWCKNTENIGYMLDKGEVLQRAICHDWDEALTSDIPYVIKHINSEVEESLHVAIQHRIDSVLKGTSDSIKNLWESCNNCKNGLPGMVITICDMLELALYCYEECTTGNTALEPVLRNCCYFLDKFEDEMCIERCSDALSFLLSEATPTISALYELVSSYKYCEDNYTIDIENYEQL